MKKLIYFLTFILLSTVVFAKATASEYFYLTKEADGISIGFGIIAIIGLLIYFKIKKKW